jgi:cytochrome bd-type quinol oxidase subunit 2
MDQTKIAQKSQKTKIFWLISAALTFLMYVYLLPKIDVTSSIESNDNPYIPYTIIPLSALAYGLFAISKKARNLKSLHTLTALSIIQFTLFLLLLIQSLYPSISNHVFGLYENEYQIFKDLSTSLSTMTAHLISIPIMILSLIYLGQSRPATPSISQLYDTTTNHNPLPHQALTPESTPPQPFDPTKKAKRYKILWIIGAIPIALLTLGTGSTLLYIYIRDHHYSTPFESALAVILTIPIIALILGLICQRTNRPHNPTNLHIYQTISLLQFSLPPIFLFGFIYGLGCSSLYKTLGDQHTAASAIWIYFITIEELICLTIIILSIIYTRRQTPPNPLLPPQSHPTPNPPNTPHPTI